jgi:transcriptional regulator with XRE-family HTH domain
MKKILTSYTEAMDIKKVFASNLRTLRKSRGLSQEALAKSIKKTVQTIRDLEAARRNPSFEVIEALGLALGVPVSLLLHNEGVKIEPLPMSKALERAMAIPDDIYDKAVSIGPESKVWDRVRVALENEIEDIEAREAKERQGKA